MSKSRSRNLINFELPADYKKIDIGSLPSTSKEEKSPIYDLRTTKLDNLNYNNYDQLSFGSTNDSDILNFNSDNDVSFDKSCSSSSLSWAEDYEDGLTNKVQGELQQMENILLRIEPIPSYYDTDEYKLWIRTFPTEKLLGKQEKYTRRQKSTTILESAPSSSGSNKSDESKLFACDKKSTSQERVSNTVINDIFENTSYHFAEQKESTLKRRKPRTKIDKSQHEHDLKVFHNSSLDAQFESVLRISRAPVIDTPPSRNIETRRNSNVIARSQVSASKWLRTDSPEFSSMPYLIVEQCSPRQPRELSVVSAKGKYKYDLKRKPPSALNKPRGSKMSPRATYITLPPIKQTNCTTSQFRSISATPRQQSKSSSALSVNSLFGGKKHKFDVENCMYANEGSKNSLIPRLQAGHIRKM